MSRILSELQKSFKFSKTLASNSVQLDSSVDPRNAAEDLRRKKRRKIAGAAEERRKREERGERK